MTVAAINKDDCAAILQQSLKLSAELSSASMCAELVRTAVWASTRSKPLSHTREVLALATPSASVFGIDKTELRTCLDELRHIGDLAVLQGGYCCPGILRFIALPRCEDCLLVGGAPTASLGTNAFAIQAHGNYRRVRRTTAEALTEGSQQELSSWMSIPDSDPIAWAAQILGSDLIEYRPSSEGAPFQVYAPELSRRGVRQSRRWQDLKTAGTGRYLARQVFENRFAAYSIVAVDNGNISAATVVSLPQSDIRRLLYAIDARADNPVVVKHWPARFEFELWSEVPVAEQRVFASLGRLVVPSERYYPRLWRFQADHDGVIVEMLQRLHIQLAQAS